VLVVGEHRCPPGQGGPTVDQWTQACEHVGAKNCILELSGAVLCAASLRHQIPRTFSHAPPRTVQIRISITLITNPTRNHSEVFTKPEPKTTPAGPDE